MRIRLSFLLLAAATPLSAQRQLTADDYARAERFLSAATAPLVRGVPSAPIWLPGDRFMYRVDSNIVVVDPAKKTKGALTEADTVGPASPPRRRGGSSIGSLSPDGKRIAYVGDYNLFVRDVAAGMGGQETRLTTDGVKDFGYATDNAGWTHSRSPVLTWSSDSKKIATFQQDERGTRDMFLVSTNVGPPKLETWKYPYPGDKAIFTIQRVVIDVDSKTVVRLQMPPDDHRSTVADDINCGGEVCDLQWLPDSRQIAFISSSRDHQHMWFRIADATTGAVRTVFEETSKTQLGDAAFPENLWRVLPASNEIIMWSQRDNWVSLYLYDLTTGKLKNRITGGDGNVDAITYIDEKNRVLYFVGLGKEPGRDPYYRHFYKINFDGTKQTLLSPANANHEIALSPDAKYFVDTYSTFTMPPVTELRDTKGNLVMPLEKADISRLVASGWKAPLPVTVKGRDGTTDIYGIMYTPSNLDSTKKYPVVNYVYPSPMGTIGSRRFSSAIRDNQSLAELGFVVVLLDGMGTNGRSKAFADVPYGKISDNTIPDQVAGIKELGKRYNFIDLDRVGIWGHSGGGFATATAMFKFGDFYKVGISESGNHDNRNYEDDWGERYQGLLRKNGPNDNYDQDANQNFAKNLKGKLLLIHGTADDNVPPYNTQLVVDALIKANKDFDLIMIPNARHGYGQQGPYIMRKRWDYFVKNLLGAEPPKEYEIGRRPVP